MIILLIAVLGGKLVFENAFADDAEAQREIIYAHQDHPVGMAISDIQGFSFEIFQDPLVFQRQIQDVVILLVTDGFRQSVGRLEAVVGGFSQIESGTEYPQTVEIDAGIRFEIETVFAADDAALR